MKNHIFRRIVTAALFVCIFMTLAGLSASADNIGTFTANSDIGTVPIYTSTVPITSCTQVGTLAGGLLASWDAQGVYLTGVPTTAGLYTVEYRIATSEGSKSVTVSYTVNPAAVQTAAPTQVPVQTVAPAAQSSGIPNITKHPTGETVEIGGTAKFIARADNAEQLIWRLVSKDTTITYPAADAGSYFSGVTVSGVGTDTLILSNIPSSLDGWSVECKFVNSAGSAYSKGAVITVVKPTPAAAATNQPSASGTTTTAVPTPSATTGTVTADAKKANIITQPVSRELAVGESYTLSVHATSPNNGTLTYQWYSSPTNDVSTASAIPNATSASYDVTQTEGTMYYWVAIQNTKEGRTSEALFSDAAIVRIAAPATPTPTATPQPADETDSSSGGFNVQLILFGVIGVLALAALIGVVVYLRMVSKEEDE